MVFRIFVEKKPSLRAEMESLAADIRSFLQIKAYNRDNCDYS